MSEHLPSKERVHRPDCNCLDCLHATIERLTAEVAEVHGENGRLTAELQGTKDELHSVDKAAKELGAERDRLLSEKATIGEQLDRVRNERYRLRAGLERIKSVDPETPLGAFYIFAKETAGEALAGGAVETDEPHPGDVCVTCGKAWIAPKLGHERMWHICERPSREVREAVDKFIEKL